MRNIISIIIMLIIFDFSISCRYSKPFIAVRTDKIKDFDSITKECYIEKNFYFPTFKYLGLISHIKVAKKYDSLGQLKGVATFKKYRRLFYNSVFLFYSHKTYEKGKLKNECYTKTNWGHSYIVYYRKTISHEIDSITQKRIKKVTIEENPNGIKLGENK